MLGDWFAQDAGEEDAMAAGVWLAASGVALMGLAVLLRRRVARYDLKDAAIDSAWTLARGRRTAGNPTALETTFNDIRVQPTWRGRAVRTVSTVAGHFAAQWLSIVALILAAAGALLVLAGLLWA